MKVTAKDGKAQTVSSHLGPIQFNDKGVAEVPEELIPCFEANPNYTVEKKSTRKAAAPKKAAAKKENGKKKTDAEEVPEPEASTAPEPDDIEE